MQKCDDCEQDVVRIYSVVRGEQSRPFVIVTVQSSNNKKHCCLVASHFRERIFFLSPNIIVFGFKMAQKISLKIYFSLASRVVKINIS